MGLNQDHDDFQNFNGDFLVKRYISDRTFMKMRSVVLRKVANRRIQTDKQTNKRWVKHNRHVLCFRCYKYPYIKKTSSVIFILVAFITFLSFFQRF